MRAKIEMLILFFVVGITLSDCSSKVSPKIVFTSWSEGKSALYTVNIDGSELKRLTDDVPVIFSPRWSPDGKQILFSACVEGEGECTGNFEIYVVNINDSSISNLTENSADDRNPDWSPDGQQIVFNSYRTGNSQIFLMNADGTNIRQLTNSMADDGNPQWSPNGSQIVFDRWQSLHNEIWLVEINGQEKKLTEGVNPLWSPNGWEIAFHKDPDIFSIRPDGTGLTNLSNSSADEFDFSWSPDSKSIAFVTNRDTDAEIYTMCVGCTSDVSQSNITNKDGSDQKPAWSPDGKKIAFLSDDELCIMDADGSQRVCLGINAIGIIAWQP